MAFYHLYLVTHHSFVTINDAHEGWKNDRNLFSRILIGFMTYFTFLPIYLIYMNVTTLLMLPFAILWQMTKVFRICMRSRRLWGNNKVQTCCGVPKVETVHDFDLLD
jgi:hypothetical protein